MDILKIILQHHDDYSMTSVFDTDEAVRAEAFTKAEAMRELVTRIKNSMPDNQEKETVMSAVREHFESMAKMIFYKRNIKED